MTLSWVTILISILILYVYSSEQAYFLKRQYIDRINDVASTWKAGANFDPNTPQENILKLLGSKDVEDDDDNGPYKTDDAVYETDYVISKIFDARKRWPRCRSIGAVRDQGHCGSCWAFGTTGAFADRLYSIATKGRFNQLLSAEELAFCCDDCGSGCNGGYPIRAWEYFRDHGVVTGGNYNTTDGCQPYRVRPCRHHEEGEEDSCDERPKESDHECVGECYGGDKTIDYDNDHRKTGNAYRLTFDRIQKDVQSYGPIAASIRVYDDFVNYKSGVYQKTENASYLGGHDVKLIGWGVERGVKYWLMVNSWGTGWGGHDGECSKSAEAPTSVESTNPHYRRRAPPRVLLLMKNYYFSPRRGSNMYLKKKKIPAHGTNKRNRSAIQSIVNSGIL